MKKNKTIDECLASFKLNREEVKSMIAKSAIHLATDCVHNFDDTPEITAGIASSLFFFNEILDCVE